MFEINILKLAVRNIINNALDAVTESEKKEINIELKRKGEYVQLTIADSGCGIAPENIYKIFDPFYTTKPVGKGTGLGLSVSYGIINNHGGTITCESEVGVGTKFKILLPIKRN